MNFVSTTDTVYSIETIIAKMKLNIQFYIKHSNNHSRAGDGSCWSQSWMGHIALFIYFSHWLPQ